ncbi:MAG: hypothetical protein A2104_07610 [Candidatus Melainabacteria bacterium GWF2_32_7]|nr:MAG: hypothetical protein A2104_07610 [Candidatus Melainabacteria bacterium GWF2_32_7]
MKAIFLIIKSRFKYKKALNGLIIAMIAAGVCALNIALALCNGFETRLVNKIISFSPQINIMTNDNVDLSGLKEEIAKIIHIKELQALAINPKSEFTQGVILKGTESKFLSQLLQPENLLVGKYPEGQEIIIGNKLAENLGVKVGDELQILTDPASFVTLKVSGIFKVGLYNFDSSTIITPNINIVNLEKDSLFSTSSSYQGIWLNNPNKAKILAQKILSTNPEIQITNWQDDNKALINAVNFEKKVVFTVLSLLIIITCLAITITQTIQILNNKNQIGILSAVGFTPKKLLFLYSLEGLFLGIIGTLLGMSVGFILAWYLFSNPIHLPIDVYHIENLTIDLKTSDILSVSLLAIILSVISSLIPAIYASKLNPVEILRN